MKRIATLALIGAFLLTLTATQALAQTFGQTNFDYWVQNLNLSLTGSSNGVPVTNGIVAQLKVNSVRIGSKDIISALDNKPVYSLDKVIVTNIFIVTNEVHKTNIYTTNVVVEAVLVPTPFSNVVYSANAKLLIKERTGTNSIPPLIVIRDQSPPIDFVINDYFQIMPISFDGRTEDFVTSGKFDFVHDLVEVVNSRIRGFTFNSNGLTNFPPQGSYFDVQGFATDHIGSLTKTNVVIAYRITRSSSTSVAGTGQIANTNGFVVIRGTISSNQGKLEVQ